MFNISNSFKLVKPKFMKNFKKNNGLTKTVP